MLEQEQEQELELEQQTQRPRANKALLRSYVEHSGAGQNFINSKHLDKALPILDQLKQGSNVTVDASGECQSSAAAVSAENLMQRAEHFLHKMSVSIQRRDSKHFL